MFRLTVGKIRILRLTISVTYLSFIVNVRTLCKIKLIKTPVFVQFGNLCSLVFIINTNNDDLYIQLTYVGGYRLHFE